MKKMVLVIFVDRFVFDIFLLCRDVFVDYVIFNFGKICDLFYLILEKYWLIIVLRIFSLVEYDKNILFLIGYDFSIWIFKISMVLIIYYWFFYFSWCDWKYLIYLFF